MDDAIVRPVKRSICICNVQKAYLTKKLVAYSFNTGLMQNLVSSFHVPTKRKEQDAHCHVNPKWDLHLLITYLWAVVAVVIYLKHASMNYSQDLIDEGRMTNIADDILCYRAHEQEHDLNVLKFLDRCVEVDMHLNPRKVKLKSPEVPFFGNMLTKQGIKPDPKTVDAIQNWPIPEDQQQLQSFLGSVNYLSRFIAGLSDLQKPLQSLIGADTPFHWTQTHTEAFNQTEKQNH